MKAIGGWLHSLQAQLILWTILPVTLVIIALAFTGVYAHQNEMQSFVSERNALVVELIAAQIEDGLVHGIISPDGTTLSEWIPQQSSHISGSLFVIDKTGEVLLHTKDPALHPSTAMLVNENEWEQTPGAVLVTADDTQLLVSYILVQGTQWIVVLQEPVSGLIGPILRFSNLGPVVAVIAIVFSVLILSFGWRTIIRPLQRLARASEQVSWGNHTAIEQPIKGVAEVQGLHTALREMLLRIEGYETSIRDYLDAMTEGQESERTRLSRELHDGPVQTLITLGQRAEMAERYIARDQLEKAIETLEELRTQEIAIVEELRRIIRNLRPIYLDDLGLLPALQMLVRMANTQNLTEVILEHPSDIERPHASIELAVYRIAQEALNNALHHSQSQRITIGLFPYENGVNLTVTDDGIGFEPSQRLDLYTQQGHFGLVGIQERVRQFSGKLNILSVPGEGTTLSVHIPDTPDPRIISKSDSGLSVEEMAEQA